VDSVDVAPCDLTANLAFEAVEHLGYVTGGSCAFARRCDDERPAVMGIQPPLDQPAQVEAVEDVRERRAFVTEATLELSHGLRAVPVELREHVGLCLGHAQVSCRPLDLDRHEVDSAFQVCNHSDIGYYDMDMTDDELITGFEAGRIAGSEFPHEAHVRVTQLLIARYGPESAYIRLVAGIKGMAERAGNPAAFHLTVTRAWFELIALALDPAAERVLLDRGLLGRYYSREALAAGRSRWIEPDLHPLVLPPPPVAAVDLVGVMRQVPAAVGVVAARVGRAVHATTVSSAASLSRQPPLILVCLARSSHVLALARESGSFALSFLASDQEAAADRFADAERPTGPAQFTGIPHHLTKFGPVIEGGTAWLGCSVAALHSGGDHEILVGEVAETVAGNGHPLVRHDGAYL
jgi:flavin reductase (DIM6/NTAB) family NADH-FMN oxidoreductase RutF